MACEGLTTVVNAICKYLITDDGSEWREIESSADFVEFVTGLLDKNGFGPSGLSDPSKDAP